MKYKVIKNGLQPKPDFWTAYKKSLNQLDELHKQNTLRNQLSKFRKSYQVTESYSF